MRASTQGPTVRRRRLAAELRRLRERAELTLEEAKDRLGWSIAKLSRIETARQGITVNDLEKALDLYGCEDADRRAALTALARNARTRGWWDAYADSLPTDYANYIALEAEAAAMRSFSVHMFHGLLQTPEYAREIITSALMALVPPAEVERRVEVRKTRQRLLTRDNPLRFWGVIDEAVLHHIVGSADIMRDQFDYLLELAERPNVQLQVLPYNKAAHPATAGAFDILEFPGQHDPDVVYVEMMTSSLYIEGDTDVYMHALAFDHLLAMALDSDESRDLIAAVAARTN
jgi:transcriptional regulator with XRE-family HTH domain